MMVGRVEVRLTEGARLLRLERVESLTCEESWENLGSRAEVKVGKRVFVKEEREAGLETRVDQWLRPGLRAELWAGYDDRLKLRWEGYVAEVKAGIPVRLVLEDELYVLKRRAVKPKVFVNTRLTELLAYCGVEDYDLLGEVSGFDFHITEGEVNVAQVLAKVKDKLYVPLFFRGRRLVAGKPYDLKESRNHLLVFGFNIAGHELEFKRAEDVRLLVKVTIHRKGGQKETFVAKGSDVDGEERTLNFYNMSRKEAEAAAERELSRLKYTGLRGRLTCFGEPVIRVGDTVTLIDCEEEEKEGKYWVDAVKTTVSLTGGIRQEVSLGPRADLKSV